MNIAIIKDMTCIDIAVFDDIETAQQFLDDGVWPEADSIAELPDGYGIGDSYDGYVWTEKPEPEPDPGPDTDPEPEETDDLTLQVEYQRKLIDTMLGAL